MYYVRLVVGTALFFAAYHAQSQVVAVQDTAAYKPKYVFTHVQQMPVFAGGQNGLLQAIGARLKYPPEALQQRLQGNVIVSFVVSPQSTVENVTVSRSVHPLLDAAAVQAVRALPAFVSPGKQAGRPVPVSLTVPIRFALPATLPSASDSAVVAAASSVANHGAWYPGGPVALRSYISNVPLPAGYPATASTAQPPCIFVRFSVSATGELSNIHAIQPLPPDERRRLHQPNPASVPDPLLIPAAEAHVRAMPSWQPAQRMGKATSQEVTLPITFGPSGPALAYAGVDPLFPLPDGEGRYVGQQIRYPAQAQQKKTSGQVIAYYEIAADGQVDNVQIIGSVSPELDAEVKRVIERNFPRYQPALHEGQPVRVYMILSIIFAAIR